MNLFNLHLVTKQEKNTNCEQMFNVKLFNKIRR